MQIILFLLLSYFVGNILSAIAVGRFCYHSDIRKEGSFNPGARNAGRVYGKKAFVLTSLGDVSKGVIVIFMGKWMGFSDLIQLSMLYTVVLGHMYPVIFRFKGGKGIATFLGGSLAFDPIIFIIFLILLGMVSALSRSLTIGTMAGILIWPIFLFVKMGVWEGVIGSCISILLIAAHRVNMLEKFNQRE